MTDLSPEKIQALIAGIAALNSIHPIIGLLIGGITVIATVVTLINSFRTKKNTEANAALAAMLKEHREQMEDISRKAENSAREIVSDFHSKVAFMSNQLNEQVTNVKKAVANAHRFSEMKLSWVPKVQDAVKKLQDEILEEKLKGAQRDEALERFVSGMKKVVQDKETEYKIFKRGKGE